MTIGSTDLTARSYSALRWSRQERIALRAPTQINIISNAAMHPPLQQWVKLRHGGDVRCTPAFPPKDRHLIRAHGSPSRLTPCLGFTLKGARKSSGPVMSPAAIARVIFSLILRRLEVTAIISSAHADPICGGQTCCFLLTWLHGLPIALLKETKPQHAFAPLPRITLAMVSRGYAGAKDDT
jgi:hypothetical protein